MVTQNVSFWLIGTATAYLLGTVHCNKAIPLKYTSWPQKQRMDTRRMSYNFPFCHCFKHVGTGTSSEDHIEVPNAHFCRS